MAYGERKSTLNEEWEFFSFLYEIKTVEVVLLRYKVSILYATQLQGSPS